MNWESRLEKKQNYLRWYCLSYSFFDDQMIFLLGQDATKKLKTNISERYSTEGYKQKDGWGRGYAWSTFGANNDNKIQLVNFSLQGIQR